MHTWQQLILTCTPIIQESISDFLTEHGALAITLTDAENQPILEPKPGEMPLWQKITITSLFEEDAELQPILNELTQTFSSALLTKARVEILANQAWERTCLVDFKPLSIADGRLWICPTWVEPPEPKAINVRLDPGLAFGSGTHETTQLCLEWLACHLQPGESIIDYGCGSGILTIASAKLGANNIWAIDYDSQALQATRTNWQTNQLPDDKLHLSTPENLLNTIVVDVIVANILAEPLCQLVNTFATHLHPGGHLILSGLLQHQIMSVLEYYPQASWTLTHQKIMGDWACLALQRL